MRASSGAWPPNGQAPIRAIHIPHTQPTELRKADSAIKERVERVESTQRVRLSYARGHVLPLHTGASAQVLLASLEPDEVEAILSADQLPRYTERTMTDPDTLRHQLEIKGPDQPRRREDQRRRDRKPDSLSLGCAERGLRADARPDVRRTGLRVCHSPAGPDADPGRSEKLSARQTVGTMAIEAYLGKAKLEQLIGTYREQDGMLFLPLPHPSGVSRWLNDPVHQTLLQGALAMLAQWRQLYSL